MNHKEYVNSLIMNIKIEGQRHNINSNGEITSARLSSIEPTS
jgi:hypothetical protein